MELAHVVGLEWHCSVKHGEEHDSATPDVHGESVVPLISEYLWRDVRRRSTLLRHLLSLLDDLADAKVAELDLALRVQEYVVEFDVAVQDALAVAVGEALDDLLEEALGDLFLESPPPADIVEQIATSANFYHEEDVLLGLEVLVESDDVLVARLLQHHHFLHHFPRLRLVGEELLIDALDGAEALA